MDWFLSSQDDLGQAAASGKRTGLHRKHSMAGAARWLFDHAGVLFAAAKAKHVRKASGPPKVREPAWAEMWEVAVLAHLCRIAVLYSGPSSMIIRSYALAAFLVNAASLRLISGLRSGPAQLEFTSDGKPFASSVAALSKGKRRSVMQPLPWLVPCVSPDTSISDHLLAATVRDVSEFLTACGACSMFPVLLSVSGAVASLPTAVTCVHGRSSDGRLVAAVAYLLEWAPLSLARKEARAVAKRKHGPRHTLPELARVMMLPEPARDLIGYWKGRPSQRLSSQSNRYSRGGERILQFWLRSLLLQWIAKHLPRCERRPLQALAAPLTAVADFDAQWTAIVTQASLVDYRHVSMCFYVSDFAFDFVQLYLVAARRGEESSALGSLCSRGSGGTSPSALRHLVGFLRRQAPRWGRGLMARMLGLGF